MIKNLNFNLKTIVHALDTNGNEIVPETQEQKEEKDDSYRSNNY